MMKENEPEIQELIGELQVIEMCKDYREEVSEQIEISEIKCAEIRTELDVIAKEIKSLELGKEGNIFNFTKNLDERKWESLQKDSKILVLEIKEYDHLIQSLKFESGILDEKIAKENELRPEFNALVLRREKRIESSGSRHFRKLLNAVKELDDYYYKRKEIVEILDEGIVVTDLINSILENLQGQDLPHKYIPDNSFQHPTITKHLVEKIQTLGLRLQKSLKEFKQELGDVYDLNKMKFVYKHEKRNYYKSLHMGELIAKNLIKQRIEEPQKKVLRIVVDTIQEISGLFHEELKVIDLAIISLKTEKSKLFKEG